MDPALRTLSLLRRRGLWLVGGPLEAASARKLLEGWRIPVQSCRALIMEDARRAPRRPVVVVDPGHLDRARALAHDLGQLESPPPLVVISDALKRGLAELGWSGSTWGVHFARAELLAEDLPVALDEAMAKQPELDESDGPPPELAEGSALAFDVGELRAALLLRAAWAAPVVEQVGSRLELRARLPELDEREARLELSWPEGSDARLSLTLQAPLPARRAAFSARRERGGLRGGLRGLWTRLQDPQVGEPGFDEAMQVRADDAGLAEARAQLSLLDDVAALEELSLDGDVLLARATGLGRDEALALGAAVLALWRGVVRGRLGA